MSSAFTLTPADPNVETDKPLNPRAIIVTAPTQYQGELAIALIGYASDDPYVIPYGQWVAKGSNLPLVGDVCVAQLDNLGDYWVTGWIGSGLNRPFAPQDFTIPAVESFAVVHGLGRLPVGVCFYDTSGMITEVGLVASDLNTMTVTQETPVAGTLVLA